MNFLLNNILCIKQNKMVVVVVIISFGKWDI